MSNRRKGSIGGPFVPVLKDTIKTLAWRATSHGARSLYVALKGRYNSTLGNAVFLSTRDATAELGSYSHRDNVRRWFRELQYYGFIIMVSPGHLGVEGKGKAPHWRLTEAPYIGEPATREFLKWDGEIFHEQKSPKHYATKKTEYWTAQSGHSKKQNPGPPIPSSVDHPSRPPPDHPSRPVDAGSGPPIPSIAEQQPGPPIPSITSLPLPALAKAGQGGEEDYLVIPDFLRRVAPAGNG